jgi:pyruvate,water dikinase
MGTRWIIEGRIDERWPVNTRGNVGEVFPEVITALGYHLGIVPAEKAWRNAYAELGIMSPDDFASDDPVIIGLYGGYCYLNLSYLRMMGVRAPGSSAEAIDVAFFGEGNPPPYVACKGDKSPPVICSDPPHRPERPRHEGTPRNRGGQLQPFCGL